MHNVVHFISKERESPLLQTATITLPKIRAVAVMFLSSGRNAWHSTWIRRYNPGDFFRDGRRVRETVDERRTPGTVFYLKVLPALQFDFGARKFVMTEINTLEPFRHMHLDQVRFGLLGDDLDTFLDLVPPPSGLWKHGQQCENSIVVQEIDEDLIDLAAYQMLSKGRDKRLNPAIGSYRRDVWRSSSGEAVWDWEPHNQHVRGHFISLRWYSKALEALMESRERLAYQIKAGR